MLQIIVNKHELFLPSKFALTLNRRSIIFDLNELYPDYTQTFEIPRQPNQHLLKFPYRTGSRYNEEFDAQILFDGRQQAIGKLRITGANITSIKCKLKYGSALFFKKVINQKFNSPDIDLYYDTIIYDDFNLTNDFAYTLVPIHNEEYYSELPDKSIGFVAFGGNQNMRHITLNRFYLPEESGSYYIPSLDKFETVNFVLTPFFYITTLIERIFNKLGFTVTSNFLRDHPTYSQMCIYNNYDIALEEPSRPIITWYSSQCLPDMQITEFLGNVMRLFNVAFDFDTFNRVAIISRNQIIATRKSKDISDILDGTIEIEKEEKPDSYSFTWEDDIKDAYLYIGEKYPFPPPPETSPRIGTWLDTVTNKIYDYKERFNENGDSLGYSWDFWRFYHPPVFIDKNMQNIYTQTKQDFNIKSDFFTADNNFDNTITNETMPSVHVKKQDKLEKMPIIETFYNQQTNRRESKFVKLSDFVTTEWINYIFWHQIRQKATATIVPNLQFISELNLTQKYKIGNQNFFITEFPITYTTNYIEKSTINMWTAD